MVTGVLTVATNACPTCGSVLVWNDVTEQRTDGKNVFETQCQKSGHTWQIQSTSAASVLGLSMVPARQRRDMLNNKKNVYAG